MKEYFHEVEYLDPNDPEVVIHQTHDIRVLEGHLLMSLKALIDSNSDSWETDVTGYTRMCFINGMIDPEYLDSLRYIPSSQIYITYLRDFPPQPITIEFPENWLIKYSEQIEGKFIIKFNNKAVVRELFTVRKKFTNTAPKTLKD